MSNNNTQIDNAKDIDAIIPLYNLIEYSNNYLETSGKLWQYYRDELTLNAAVLIDFPTANSASFNFKQKMTGQTGNDGTKDFKLMAPLKSLSTFWRTLEMPLLNCEINLILTWWANGFIIANPIDNQVPTFAITDTKLYVLDVTLSAQDNAKLLQHLKSVFRRTINWNKYQSEATIQRQNQYLDYQIDPDFQVVNTLFVLSFKNNVEPSSYVQYFLPNIELKDCNVMINETFLRNQ